MVAKLRNIIELPPKEQILQKAYAEQARYAEERQDELRLQRISRPLTYLAAALTGALGLAYVVYVLMS